MGPFQQNQSAGGTKTFFFFWNGIIVQRNRRGAVLFSTLLQHQLCQVCPWNIGFPSCIIFSVSPRKTSNIYWCHSRFFLYILEERGNILTTKEKDFLLPQSLASHLTRTCEVLLPMGTRERKDPKRGKKGEKERGNQERYQQEKEGGGCLFSLFLFNIFWNREESWGDEEGFPLFLSFGFWLFQAFDFGHFWLCLSVFFMFLAKWFVLFKKWSSQTVSWAPRSQKEIWFSTKKLLVVSLWCCHEGIRDVEGLDDRCFFFCRHARPNCQERADISMDNYWLTEPFAMIERKGCKEGGIISHHLSNWLLANQFLFFAILPSGRKELKVAGTSATLESSSFFSKLTLSVKDQRRNEKTGKRKVSYSNSILCRHESKLKKKRH